MKLQNAIATNIKFGVKISGISLPINTFRYIKLDIIENNGNSITSVGDVSYTINSNQIPLSPMTTFITGSYEVVDWSGYYNNLSLYEPWKAFDKQTGTNNRWLTSNAGSQYVTLDIGQVANVSDFTDVRILPANHNEDDWTSRSIRNFKILISQDNVDFYEVLYETEIDDWQSGVEKIFTIT